ncbi:MAG TPA: MFS transporter [Ilumatobacter sp.]|nr:MFS transporter [Ilumatobacter sp.]
MTTVAPSPAGGERFPGWRVVTGGFVVLSTSSGLGFYGLAVYLNAFSHERGWDVASISLATTIFFVVSGVCGLGIARLIARLDLRAVIVAGGVLGAVSLLLLGQVQSRAQLYLVYVLFGLAFACAGLLPVTTAVTRWFHARRSVALSVVSTGLSAGGVVLTPATKWLLDERGLAAGTPILAAVFFAGTVPFALWLIRPDPAALGWLPDGERAAPGIAPAAPTGMLFAEAVRTRFFVCSTLAYVLVLGSQVGGLQQIVKLVEERTDASAAAFATLVLALASIVARLAGGRLVERVSMLGFTVVLSALQGAALAWIAVGHSRLMLFPAIVVFGATVGNILMLQPLLIAARFGVRDYPRLYSRAQFVSTFGVAGGPYLLGVLHDHAGGYRSAYLVAAACALTGAMVLAAGGTGRRA